MHHGVASATPDYDLLNMTPSEIVEAYHAALSDHRMFAPYAFRLFWKGLSWAVIILMMSLKIREKSHQSHGNPNR